MELSVRYEVDLIDGREEVDVDIYATISGKYVPAKIAADPDDSYDAEYPEVDLDSVIVAGTKENVTSLLTDISKKSVMALLWQEVYDWEDCVIHDYEDEDLDFDDGRICD